MIRIKNMVTSPKNKKIQKKILIFLPKHSKIRLYYFFRIFLKFFQKFQNIVNLGIFLYIFLETYVYKKQPLSALLG